MVSLVGLSDTDVSNISADGKEVMSVEEESLWCEH